MPPPYGRVLSILLYVVLPCASCLRPCALYFVVCCCTAMCLPPTAMCSLVHCMFFYCHVPPAYGHVLSSSLYVFYCHVPPAYGRVLSILLYVVLSRASPLRPCALYFVVCCCTVTCLPPTAVCSLFCCMLYCHVPPPYGHVLSILCLLYVMTSVCHMSQWVGRSLIPGQTSVNYLCLQAI